MADMKDIKKIILQTIDEDEMELEQNYEDWLNSLHPYNCTRGEIGSRVVMHNNEKKRLKQLRSMICDNWNSITWKKTKKMIRTDRKNF